MIGSRDAKKNMFSFVRDRKWHQTIICALRIEKVFLRNGFLSLKKGSGLRNKM